MLDHEDGADEDFPGNGSTESAGDDEEHVNQIRLTFYEGVSEHSANE